MIKPYTYGATPVATAAAPATGGGRLKPFTYSEPSPAPVIPAPPTAPSFVDKVKSFFTPFGGAKPKNPGYFQSLPDMTIKPVPFVDAGITVKQGLPADFAKGLIETPERVIRSFTEAGKTYTDPLNAKLPNDRQGKYVVPTYQETQRQSEDMFNKLGFTPVQSQIFAGLLSGGSAILDIAGIGSLLSSGVAKLATRSALTSAEVNTASDILGNPRNAKEINTSLAKIQKVNHPDMPGANIKISAQANDAARILRQAEKEGVLGTMARGAQQAQKPISELFTGAKATPKPLAGLIPEKTGQVKPFDYSKVEAPTPSKVTALEAPKAPTPESPAIPAAPAVEGISAPVTVPEQKKLTVVPEEVKGVPKERVLGPGNTTEVPLKIDGVRVSRPTQLVTKRDLSNMADTLPGKEAEFKVVSSGGSVGGKIIPKGSLMMEYDNGTTKMRLRPSALGLVEDNIKVGDSIKISKEALKAPGTSMRAVDSSGKVNAMAKGTSENPSMGPAKIDSFEERADKREEKLLRVGEKGRPVEKEVKIYKKVDDLIKKYAVRVGEGYLPKGAAGVFYHATENIRLKGMNELSVAAHEITHRLDLLHTISKGVRGVKGLSKEGKPIYDQATAAHRKELTDVYVNHYPGGKPEHELKKRMVEGYATLLQKYVEMPTTMEQNYPLVVKDFLKPGGKFYKPVIGEIIEDLKTFIEDYQALDALDKVGARVTSDLNPVGKESFLTMGEAFRTEVADEIYPIEKLASKAGVINTKEDPSLWMRQYNNTSAIFANNVQGTRGYWTYRNGTFHKTYDYNWGTLQKDLQKSKTYDEFGHYLVARDQHFNFLEMDRLKKEYDNALAFVEKLGGPQEARLMVNEDGESPYDELVAAHKAYQAQKEIMENNGFSRGVVKKAYEDNQERFAKEEEQYDNLVREDLNFLHNDDVGLVSSEEFERLTSKEGYASLKRQFYDDIVGDEGSVRKGVAGPRPSSLKGRTGSSRTIVHPVLSGVKNHAEILRKGLRQIVYNKVVKIALTNKFPDLFQQQKVVRVPDANTGRMTYPQERDPNIIMGRIGGKRVPILTDSDIIKKTLDEVLDFKSIGLFQKLLQGSSRFFTKMTTGLFPGFTATNFTIDQIAAVAQTQHNYIPVYSAMKEFYKVLSKADSPEARFFEEYMVMGGERQTMVGWQDLSARELAQKIANERNGILKAMDTLNKGADLLGLPQKYSEIVTRATEYMKSRKAGDPQIVALEKAGRITAPFHHIGRFGGGISGQIAKTWVRSIPFFNPGIQVLEQAYRSGAGSGSAARNRMLFVALAVTAAEVGSFALINSKGTKEQKDQYKDLDPAEMAAYMWFPDPDGSGLIKIRMPNLLNVVGAQINMELANQTQGANYKVGDFLDAGYSFLPAQLNPVRYREAIWSWVPQLLKPALLTSANKKDFPDVRDLESQSQLRKPPGERSTPATPFLTKKLGEALNISPIKLDYLITGYLGRVSGFATGKPGILNPFSTLKKDYYFDGGRRLQNYYDEKTTNDQQFNSLHVKDNPLVKLTQQGQKIIKRREQLKEVADLISDLDDVDMEKHPEQAASLRDKILEKIDKL